jgi:D-glycero-beta-D-manno-heptose-7-phosphate kinase
MQSNSPDIDATKTELMQALKAMQGVKVLILGDGMIDHYLEGSVHRISPEAPVPIVQHTNEYHSLGGAANVALNVHALGATPLLVSLVGQDSAGDLFSERLRQNLMPTSGIIRSLTRPTTLKTRVLGNGQQMLRIDHEVSTAIDEDTENALFSQFEHFLEKERPKLLIFEDYNKGLLTESIIRACIKAAIEKGLFVAVDPKFEHFYEYKNAHFIKPNLKEIRDIVPFEVAITPQDLQKACDYLRERLYQTYTMITLSEHGVYLEENGLGQIYPTKTSPVADVSGAGDTVMSIAALALMQGWPLAQVALLSNLAGRQVVSKKGVVPIDLKELTHTISMI